MMSPASTKRSLFRLDSAPAAPSSSRFNANNSHWQDLIKKEKRSEGSVLTGLHREDGERLASLYRGQQHRRQPPARDLDYEEEDTLAWKRNRTATLGRRTSPTKTLVSSNSNMAQLTLPRRSSVASTVGSRYNEGSDSNLSELPSLLNRLCSDVREEGTPERAAGSCQQHQCKPVGMDALESVYAPMRNLSRPLIPASLKHYGKEASSYPQSRHDELFPQQQQTQQPDDEACSLIGEIPPLLAPVQSHAILEQSYGHDLPLSSLPRTPGLPHRSGSGVAADRRKALSPLPLFNRGATSTPEPSSASSPPPSTSSPMSAEVPPLPELLALNESAEALLNHSQRRSKQQRISLMSTGSSENSSDRESPPLYSVQLLPGAKTKADLVAEWNESHSGRRSRSSGKHQHNARDPSPCPSEELLSVSQQGETEVPDLGFDAPPLCEPKDQPSHYMNILYNAVQRQGGRGSVENALSPYLAMTRRPQNSDSESIYAVPTIATAQQHPRHLDQSIADRLFNRSCDEGCNSNSSQVGGRRGSRNRSSSTSRLQEITSRMRKGVSKGGGGGRKKAPQSASEKARQLLEWKALLQEVERKRLFRVGLNLFNCKPELGIDFLVRKGFLELSPVAVATFLKENHGLSQDKIGDYLGDLQSPFSMRVLSCFMHGMEFRGMRVDKALRHLLRHFRVPGEAQKIERIMEEFGRRFNKCNASFAAKLKASDSTVTLAFAIMLLNTDLHTPSLKSDRKMSSEDFVNNLRGVDAGADFDPNILKSIYKSMKKSPFESRADHVVQTQLLQRGFNGAHRPDLAVPHRRLVCVCRLYEVTDVGSVSGISLGSRNNNGPNFGHSRDLFLFNDLLVVTKQNRGGDSSPTFAYRRSLPLAGMEVSLFSFPSAPFGVLVCRKRDGEELLRLNAGSQHDRYKFVMDLQESIFEMDWTQDEMAGEAI